MGTCGTKQAVITNSIMPSKQSKKEEDKVKEENEEEDIFKDIKEVEESKIETKEIKNEKIIKEIEESKNEKNENKDKELKESITLKPEINKKNIDLRRSQTLTKSQKENKDLKDAMDSLHNDIFEKSINIYTEPGKPHPPFEIINKQLEVSLCRIINKNNNEGIGFFCLIPFPTINYLLPVLITNNLESDEISLGKNINIILNFKKKFELNINENRKIYNKNGIIMIEIKESDELDIENFLYFINFNNVDNCQKSFNAQNCYFFRYSKNEKIDCCLGLMSNIDDYNYKFMFSIDPVREAIGSPIISTMHDVIGIHMKDMEGNYLHNYIREFYEMESIKENKDEITIIYQIIKELDTKINIFGKTFVDNNKDKCKLIIDGKEQELVECLDNQNYSDIFDFEGNYTEIAIKLKGINNIIDASYMFKDCVALIALPDLGKWDTSKVISMEGLFWKCWTLIYISNSISNWNISNVKTIYGMFVGCIYIMYLPDISNWNTDNLEIREELFHSCQNLRKIPDISKWNTEKIKSLSFVFTDCKTIKSLPDISNWNTNNVTEFIGIFEECESLKTLPDISKWNTNNVTTLDGVFNCCKSLISLPDISKWNTNNVTSMRFLFQSCFSLTTLPDISKWNTEKVTTMQATFNLCISLTELPDISKWNTSNVTNMIKLFNMCEKLQSFPNIFTWDTSKVMNNTQMFNHCYAAVLLLAGNNLIQ